MKFLLFNVQCSTFQCFLYLLGVGDEAAIPQTLIIGVYATKEGYEDSEVATMEINLRGDVNTDGIVNGTDIQEVINIIVGGE